MLLWFCGYSLSFSVLLESDQDDYGVDFSKVTLHTPRDLVPVRVGTRVAGRPVEGVRPLEAAPFGH